MRDSMIAPTREIGRTTGRAKRATGKLPADRSMSKSATSYGGHTVRQLRACKAKLRAKILKPVIVWKGLPGVGNDVGNSGKIDNDIQAGLWSTVPAEGWHGQAWAGDYR
jgi:hypothetical protein